VTRKLPENGSLAKPNQVRFLATGLAGGILSAAPGMRQIEARAEDSAKDLEMLFNPNLDQRSLLLQNDSEKPFFIEAP
jgi:hypothetical protein